MINQLKNKKKDLDNLDSNKICNLSSPLHDNIESSINDNRYWLSTYHITDGKHSIHAAPGAFNHKLTAHAINNTLIISDNEKGYESIKDYIDDNILNEYDIINSIYELYKTI